MERDYTIDQVANIVQVHRKTVEDWIKTGKLDAYQLTPGGRYRVTPRSLSKFRATRRVKPQQRQAQKEDLLEKIGA